MGAYQEGAYQLLAYQVEGLNQALNILLQDDSDTWLFYVQAPDGLYSVSPAFASRFYVTATQIIYNPFIGQFTPRTFSTAPLTPTKTTKDPSLMAKLAIGPPTL